MSKCSGCGAILQNENAEEIGYTPKLDNELCQRCFRIKHYDDLVKSYKGDFDNYDILNTIDSRDDLVVWVVDLFDFDSNIINGLNRHLLDKDIILVGTKRDLLPDTLGNAKLMEFVHRRLKFYGISVDEIIFTADHGKYGGPDVLDAIDEYRDGRDVIIMGQANVGKSTLINALANTDITISKYPGTTLDLISIPMGDYTLFDTPGLIREDNMQFYTSDEDLDKIVPKKIKPKVFQIYQDSSFSIGGVAQILIEVKEKTSVVFYVNDSLEIHRAALKNSESQWEREFNLDSNPKVNGQYKLSKELPIMRGNFDVVINGLGFINIKSGVKSVRVLTNKNVEVLVREALV